MAEILGHYISNPRKTATDIYREVLSRSSLPSSGLSKDNLSKLQIGLSETSHLSEISPAPIFIYMNTVFSEVSLASRDRRHKAI